MATKQLHTEKWGLILCLSLALVLILGPLSTMVFSATVPTVRVQEQETMVIVGRYESFDIVVDDVRDLYAFELIIQYDPSILDITDEDAAMSGVQIGAGNIFDGLSWHTDLNQVNETTGVMTYMVALDSLSTAGVNGSGSLARVNFFCPVPGASPVELTSVILVTRVGHAIEHNAIDGRVRVVEIPYTATPTIDGWISPTPTNTPMPLTTSTPGDWPTVEPSATATPTEDGTAPSPTPTTDLGPMIYVDPELKYVMPGTDSYVDISVSGADDLYSCWIKLEYDPSVISIQDADAAEPGVQVAAGTWFDGKAWYLVANSVDAVAGTITFGAKLSFAETAGPPAGMLARIPFRADALGASPMTLAEVILADQQGTSIEPDQYDGVVIVTSMVPTSTPTPDPGGVTPTPTATPQNPCTRPVLYLEPEAVDLVVGEEQDIDVMVSDGSDLYGVEFGIGFDPAVIEIVDLIPSLGGTQLAYGTFLSPDSVAENSVDAAAGQISFAISQAPPSVPANGTGVVATLRVRAVAQGATSLGIHSTQLLDSEGLSVQHTAAGGFVAVNAQTVIGRVYLQGRTLHSGAQVLWDGMPLATTGDDGGFAFACPVSPGDVLDVQAVMAGHLTAAASIDVPIDAVVDLGDTTLMGGDCVGPRHEVARTGGCPGDAIVIVPSGPNGRVDILDLTFVAGYFGAASTDADWSPTVDGCHPEYLAYWSDINDDQVCNIFDLVQVGNNFGLMADQPW